MNGTLTTQQLDRRAATIMRGVRTGQVSPRSDAITELAELSIATEDKPIKPVVVARLTVTRANGMRTIVEIWQGATFHNFYRFFRQQGARRSTKQLIRTANRNEGCSWIGIHHQEKPGLETIAKRLEFYASQSNPVVSKKFRIIKKRAYRKLLTMCPDQLGLTKTSPLPIYRPVALVRPA